MSKIILSRLWDSLGDGGQFTGIVISLLYLIVLLVAVAFAGVFGPLFDYIFVLLVYTIPSIIIVVGIAFWAFMSAILILLRASQKRTYDERDRAVLTFVPMMTALMLTLIVGLFRMILQKEEPAPSETKLGDLVPPPATDPAIPPPPPAGGSTTPKQE